MTKLSRYQDHFRLRVKQILLGMMLMVHGLAIGQQSNTFYLMHQVPQSNLLNPAVQLQCKWFVGVPLLASTHFSYDNSAFTYQDLAGTDTWNLEGILDQMHRVDLYAAAFELQPVSLGYRRKSYYFTFNIAEKVRSFQTVPRDLAEIILHGNGPFIGETAHFNALRTSVYYLREYSLGVSKVLDRYLTVGVRAKLLFGKADLYTGHSDMGISTSNNNFELLLEGDYALNSSFPVTLVQDPDGTITDVTLNELNYTQFLLNRRNPGVALDLGIIYRLDEATTLSASLLDIGFIRWKSDLNNIRGTTSFAFEGLNVGDDIVSETFLNETVDSLINSITTEATTNPYSSFLPARLFIGGSRKVKENISVGVVNRNVFFRNKIHSSVTLSAQADLAQRFLATLSWSYLNNSYKNLGAGLAYHGRGFQFHVVSDNLLGFLYPFNTRSVNLRMGVNVMFGCPKNRNARMENESYGNQSGAGDCSWTGKPKNREKLMKKASRIQNRR